MRIFAHVLHAFTKTSFVYLVVGNLTKLSMCLQLVRITELNYYLVIPNTSKFDPDVGQTIINQKYVNMSRGK